MNVVATKAAPPRRGSMALAIKRDTAGIHRTAEAAVARARPFEDRASYGAYLTALHQFYEAVEPRIAAHALPGVDLAARRKLPHLAADLRALGLPRPKPVTLPVMPRIANVASAFGVAYVLEGKTLGSRFLLEEARTRLALDVDAGARFFAGYGEETGPMWTQYRGALEAFVAREGHRASVLEAARATFAAFVAWIDGLNPARA